MHDLARQPGAHREEQSDFPAPEVLGTDVISVPQGRDLELLVSFESVSDGIWVSGTVNATATGECGRCLDSVSLNVSAAIQGLFLYPGHELDGEDESEDVFEWDGETIDLEELVRDAVASGLPFTPLCEPDCPGLCDQCGARLVDEPDHAHEVLDPRWAALEALADTSNVDE
jgi:uncharacterized protein